MIIQGILLGISLSFMIGPLLFSIVEAGIAQGFRAGLAVGAGIWLSDLFYVALVMSSVEALESMTKWPGFKMWAGIVGGGLLVVFGIGSMLSAHKKKIKEAFTHIPGKRSYKWENYFLRGFLLNTINPFTVFFWLSIAGAVIIPNGWDYYETIYFFAGMLGTLVVTDTLKAHAARHIRGFLTPKHIFWVQSGIGITLLVFGIVLMIRVL